MSEVLTESTFKEKISDLEGGQLNFKGDKPAIIDFYADWCQPCKMLDPVLEELSQEYEGRVDFFKVDTEAEQNLAMTFGIQSIPSILFIPMEGNPSMAQGAAPKESLKQAISEVLKVE